MDASVIRQTLLVGEWSRSVIFLLFVFATPVECIPEMQSPRRPSQRGSQV
ncbi:hypothetical protein AWB78_04011 [Caballeronia calidae]|uniref:Uncharacterized protein n=1 Tax=Caballeronia calidae TaxID=1777139 RepID=A0A158CKE0_9BURK|nr:hypothetical protein AWB78_04011 [Caballeronia calidae]